MSIPNTRVSDDKILKAHRKVPLSSVYNEEKIRRILVTKRECQFSFSIVFPNQYLGIKMMPIRRLDVVRYFSRPPWKPVANSPARGRMEFALFPSDIFKLDMNF